MTVNGAWRMSVHFVIPMSWLSIKSIMNRGIVSLVLRVAQMDRTVKHFREPSICGMTCIEATKGEYMIVRFRFNGEICSFKAKSCPACQSNRLIVEEINYEKRYCVTCCACKASSALQQTPKLAIQSWNKEFQGKARISNFAEKVQIERNKQDMKWGEQNHEAPDWLMILAEEMGELNKAVLESKLQGKLTDREQIDKLIQVAAVCQAMYECTVRNNRKGL